MGKKKTRSWLWINSDSDYVFATKIMALNGCVSNYINHSNDSFGTLRFWLFGRCKMTFTDKQPFATACSRTQFSFLLYRYKETFIFCFLMSLMTLHKVLQLPIYSKYQQLIIECRATEWYSLSRTHNGANHRQIQWLTSIPCVHVFSCKFYLISAFIPRIWWKIRMIFWNYNIDHSWTNCIIDDTP